MASPIVPILLLGGGAALLLSSGKKKGGGGGAVIAPGPGVGVEAADWGNLAVARSPDIFRGKSNDELNEPPLLEEEELWPFKVPNARELWGTVMASIMDPQTLGFVKLKLRTDGAWEEARGLIETLAKENPRILFIITNENGSRMKPYDPSNRQALIGSFERTSGGSVRNEARLKSIHKMYDEAVSEIKKEDPALYNLYKSFGLIGPGQLLPWRRENIRQEMMQMEREMDAAERAGADMGVYDADDHTPQFGPCYFWKGLASELSEPLMQVVGFINSGKDPWDVNPNWFIGRCFCDYTIGSGGNSYDPWEKEQYQPHQGLGGGTGDGPGLGVCDNSPWEGKILYKKTPRMRGLRIRMLHRVLCQLGFFEDESDDIFGPKTKAAVKNFQRSAGITADGAVGPVTTDKMRLQLRAMGSHFLKASQTRCPKF